MLRFELTNVSRSTELIMLGAIGQRYATIASGALILSLYIMISIGQQSGVAPEESWALLSR